MSLSSCCIADSQANLGKHQLYNNRKKGLTCVISTAWLSYDKSHPLGHGGGAGAEPGRAPRDIHVRQRARRPHRPQGKNAI